MTDLDLKLTLAGMIPKVLLVTENWTDGYPDIPSHSFRVVEADGCNHHELKDNELLHICSKLGAQLNPRRLSDALVAVIQFTTGETSTVECRYLTATATWQQWVQALALVKHVKLHNQP